MNMQKEIVSKYQKQINLILSDPWELHLTEYDCSFSEKFETGKYELKMNNIVISSFELVPMINCCGILVSTRVLVDKDYRNLGLGTILNSLRIDIARNLGYGVLLCTDVISNTYQQKVLSRNGWKLTHEFINPRTKNRIGVHIINL